MPDMIKQAVEAALKGEMTAHLGMSGMPPRVEERQLRTVRRPRPCRRPPGRPRCRCRGIGLAGSNRHRAERRPPFTEFDDR